MREAAEAPEGFHARFSARGRVYEYRVLPAPVRSPLRAGRVLQVPGRLDRQALEACAAAGVRAYTQTGQTTSPEFEFFDDYDAFLYNALTGRAHRARYLGGGTSSSVSEEALDDAIARLRAQQGGDPARWRAPMPQIQFQSLDVADLPPVPWENRGTWGEAIAIARASP